jgi:hypothetical protein
MNIEEVVDPPKEKSMLPVSTTHALALARTEEVRRKAARSWLREPAPAHTTWLASTLSALTRPLHHEAHEARTAPASPAACCA